MALMVCGECNHEYSDQADSCPHCGAPNPAVRASAERDREKRVRDYVEENRKSLVAAILITVLLGPLGYLYVSVVGGAFAILLALGVASFAPPLLVFVWGLCVLAAPFEVIGQNRRLQKKAELIAG